MKASREGYASTHLLERGIIETRYVGHVKAEAADRVREDLARLLTQHPGAHWLIDVADVDRLETAGESSRLGVFKTFEDHKGGKIALVVKSPALRMLGLSVSFAFRLGIKTFDAREPALAFLRGLPS